MAKTTKKKIKRKIKKKTSVDIWLERETPHKRKAFENASSYFAKSDALTVNTIEAIYAQESRFGTSLRKRGIKGAAGEFHLEKATAERYKLIVSKENDQRFDIDYASITAARYLKYLDRSFSKQTKLLEDRITIPIEDALERKKFVLAAYNGGEGKIAWAQSLAKAAGKDPTKWAEVKKFLRAAKTAPRKVKEIQQYVEKVSNNEIKFSEKSIADKNAKYKRFSIPKDDRCIDGHWITKDHHHIFICR